jgi:hypothetical protein
MEMTRELTKHLSTKWVKEGYYFDGDDAEINKALIEKLDFE